MPMPYASVILFINIKHTTYCTKIQLLKRWKKDEKDDNENALPAAAQSTENKIKIQILGW